MRWRSIALIGIAIVVGAFLRLANMELMEFKSDEGRVLIIVWRWFTQGVFPRVGGLTSVGSYFSPLFSYLLSIPYVVYRDPVWVASCIAIFNVLGLFLCYLMVRRFWGERVAIVSVILFAVSPWAVLYSRKIWNPNLCPPFTIIFFYSLCSMVIDRKGRYIFPLILSWLILIQLHPVYVVMGIVPVVSFALYRPRCRWFHIAAGLVLGLLPLCFYAHFIWLRRIGLTQRFGEWISSGGSGRVIPLAQSLIHAWEMPYVANISLFRLDTLLGASAWSSIVSDPLSLFFNSSEHVLMVLGLLFIAWGVLPGRGTGSIRQRLDPRCVILLLWFLVPSIVFGFTRVLLADHYFIILYPSQFILVGLAFERLWIPLPRVWTRRRLLLLWRGALIILVSGIAMSQMLFMYRFYRLIEINGGANGDYGTAYIHKKRAVDFVLNMTREKPFTIGQNFGSPTFVGPAYRYLLLEQGEEPGSAGDGLDCYVIWDKYFRRGRGEYPGVVPRGWRQQAGFGPILVYWKPAVE